MQQGGTDPHNRNPADVPADIASTIELVTYRGLCVRVCLRVLGRRALCVTC